jgi:hypothetical protein
MKPGEKKGQLIITGLLLLAVVLSLAAYRITGDMNIEDRFTHAVGLESGGEEVNGGGWSGFAIEGSPLVFGVVLGILVIGCYAAYRYFSI